MDVEVIKKTKNEIEFKIIGDRYTVTGFLQKKLLENKDVEMAAYYVDHPEKDECIFTLRTAEGKDAKEILDKAMADCKKELAEFNKQALALLSKVSTPKRKGKKK